MNTTNHDLLTKDLDIDKQIQNAVSNHQNGNFNEAEMAYRKILQIQPKQPDVNHNMGVLQVQLNKFSEALPYFMIALGAEPSRGQFWLSYIDVLIRTNQLNEAKKTLELTKQQGLQGKAFDAISEKLHQSEQLALLQLSTCSGSRGEELCSSQHSSSTLEEPSADHIQVLAALLSDGQLDKAEVLARAMTIRFPTHWAGWKMLGVLLSRMGRNEDAIIPMQKTAILLPNDPEAHNNLGIAFQESGQIEQAEASYRCALKLNENYAEAHNNLGSLLHNQNIHQEAEKHYQSALKIHSDYVKALNNLATLYAETGNMGESEDLLRRVLEINPKLPEVHFNLGSVLFNTGKLKEAQAHFECAIELKPDFAQAYCDLGAVHFSLGENDLALTKFNEALQINPDLPAGSANIGLLLYDAKMHNDAEILYRRALSTDPDFAGIHANLGVLLHDLGRLDEAVAHLRKAIEIKPNLETAYSNLIFSLCHSTTSDPSTMTKIFHEFDRQFVINAPHLKLENTKEVDRVLQIGFVSGDFMNHPVSYFMEPLLSELAKSNGLVLHAYHVNRSEDHVTHRVKQYFTHWHPVPFLSKKALAEKIASEKIDILIDLSGHTALNRLLTLSWKPAPIQMSWLGCPISTGMSSVDYFIADKYMLPPGKMEEQFIEKILWLPAHAPFLPFRDAPPIYPLPALTNNYLTFGSFNRAGKINKLVIRRWSELLRALPDSRMLLGAIPNDSTAMMIEWFASEGIDKGRLNFYPPTGFKDFLELHHQVDITLDTFPFNGATVALNSISMGVPTLTVAGNTTVGRLGFAIMQHLGLDEFIAIDEADFLEKGKSLENNLIRLASIRASMRDRFNESILSDGKGIAASLEKAFRIAWRRWCTDTPQVNIDVSDLNRNHKYVSSDDLVDKY